MTASLNDPFAILDNSPIGHFILDQSLTVRFWNRCLEEWTGLLRKDMVGSHLSESLPHLAGPKYLGRIESVLRGGPPTTFSSQLHKHLIPAPLPNGRLRIQYTVASPLATGTAGIFDALFSIEDVTSLTHAIDQHGEALSCLTAEVERRRQAEESLREMDRLKNIFIASAAHELNSPLAAILGYAELLRDMGQLFDDTRKVEYANEIVESGEVLSKLINDLLDIARFEEGHRIPLDMRPVDPNELLRKTVRHFLTRRIRHAFVLDLEPAAGRNVLVDPTRIRQVLENILGNAVKYSAPETSIAVRSAWDNSGIIISVADQGIGMTPEESARIFEKFYRADALSSNTRGLGLGMYIVKQIIDQHGGTITVNSSPGEGTTVALYLPR